MIIKITELKVKALVGILEWEKTTPQEIIINLAVNFDAKKASLSNNINDTIDYASLSDAIIDFMQSKQHLLLETLVKEIAELTQAFGPELISSIEVEVQKPNAISACKTVSVTAMFPTKEKNKYTLPSETFYSDGVS